MNEQAKEIIAQMLQRVLDGVDTATDFAAQEIPIVVEQLLMWHMVEAALYSVLGLLGVLGVVIVLYKWGRKIPLPEEDRGFMRKYHENLIFEKGGDVGPQVCLTVPLTTLVLFVSLVSFMCNITTFLQIWIAPKLYLLEYGANLIK